MLYEGISDGVGLDLSRREAIYIVHRSVRRQDQFWTSGWIIAKCQMSTKLVGSREEKATLP